MILYVCMYVTVEYGLYGQLSWDSVVTVTARLLAGWIRVQLPEGARDICIPYTVSDSGAYFAFWV
jgi:hypothetical protein